MEYFSIHRITTLLFGVILVAIGAIILIRKKPLIINSRWLLLVLILVLFGPVIQLAIRGVQDYGYMLGICLAFMAFLSYILKGFMILGADGKDFHKVFTETLREKNYQFKETFSSVEISDPNLEISIALQSWTGSGQLRLKSGGNQLVFRQIIKTLRSKQIVPNRGYAVFQIILGLILLLLQFRMIIP